MDPKHCLKGKFFSETLKFNKHYEKHFNFVLVYLDENCKRKNLTIKELLRE